MSKKYVHDHGENYFRLRKPTGR